MAETSRLWPYIRAIGKALTIPGTKIGLSILTDLQDQLSADEFHRHTKDALAEIRRDTAGVLGLLRDEGLTPPEQDLRDATVAIAEEVYLAELAGEFLYADFKGIEQVEQFVSLKLDEIFVNLKVRPERGLAERDDERRAIAEQLARAAGRGDEDLSDAERRLAEMDADRARGFKREAQPMRVDEVLAAPGGTVLLGGPGTGKTTLVKRLARSCALGPDVLKDRYPQMPWCFPVVVSAAEFDDRRRGRALLAFLRDELAAAGGEALGEAFDAHWAAGQCLVLLDGLDEVAETRSRIDAARAAGGLVRELAGNRAVLTCRIVGYSVCRLSVPAGHVVLQPWQREDVETFARQWHEAYERVRHAEQPDLAAAAREADGLIEAVRANPRVESLATNPLMLTIIALIKQRNVTLPDRRVELYQVAVDTLLRSWNKARSLARDHAAPAEDLGLAQTKRVWGEVAHWMHREVSRGVCHRAVLERRLTEIIARRKHIPEFEASKIAESYLQAAADRTGLLEARGANVFAFVHQTFQEYLAAWHLSFAYGREPEKVREIAHDPRWHEVIRLAAGVLSSGGDDEAATALLRTIMDYEPDALEPWLCRSLRLAAACIADRVEAPPDLVDDLVVRICERVRAVPYRAAIEGLTGALAAFRGVSGEPAVSALCRAAKHGKWRVRMQAARLLGTAAGTSAAARQYVERLFAEDLNDVKARAALGLWRSGIRRDEAVVKAVLYGLTSGFAAMKTDPDPDLLSAAGRLLSDGNSHVRLRAAEVLGSWGPREEALPALVKLLSDGRSYVRLGAASVLGSWGRREEALPALVKLLSDGDSDARYRAAEVLGSWGHREEARPALVKLLSDGDPYVRLSAASVLGSWGRREEAVPALVKLLSDGDWSVRYRAASVLGSWGHREEALPALVKLLSDRLVDVRSEAAEALGGWGGAGGAAGAILPWLVEGDMGAAVRVFEEGGGGGLRAEGEVERILLECIRPKKSDDREKRRLRGIVFRWVWGLAEGGRPEE